MAPVVSTLPFILLLSLLAAASPSHSSPELSSSSPSSSLLLPPATKKGFSKSSINEKMAVASTRPWELTAPVTNMEGKENDEEIAKSTETSGMDTHKIQVREAGAVRFFSGSRYGRSGRSSGGSESEFRSSHGSERSSNHGMSLRSSNPIVQPRHDRFFLGSRYGKRSQGGQKEEWEGKRRWGVMHGEEEEEADQAEEEENEQGEDRTAEDEDEVARRNLEEAMMRFRDDSNRKLPDNDKELISPHIIIEVAAAEPGNGAEMMSQRPSLEIQPVSCIFTGIGNLYRCYDGRREGTGVH